MPKSLQYSAGSVIYFQGDAAEKVLLLQNGSVKLGYQDIETGQEVQEILNKGEFFGVKSALGRYPREENAIVVQNSTVMAFSVAEFEAVAKTNPNLIMKMLKIFSNQMRRVHKQVASLMKEETQQDPAEGLCAVGEFYLKNKKYAHAKYIFGKYLAAYPRGKDSDTARAHLNTVVAHIAKYGDGLTKPDSAAADEHASDKPAPAAASDVGNAESQIASQYYDAVSLVSQAKYMPACQALKKIADGDDAEFAPKAAFELGRCMFLMGKYDGCIQYYTQTISKYPKHQSIAEILFCMGQSHEKSLRKDQAVAFYKKAATLSTDEDVSAKINRALKAVGVRDGRI
jgi:CRP-like cAMP-binding protein